MYDVVYQSIVYAVNLNMSKHDNIIDEKMKNLVINVIVEMFYFNSECLNFIA